MKKAYKSKTVGVNMLGMLALVHPPTVEWAAHHAREVLFGTFLVNLVLRLITHNRVELNMPNPLKKFITFGLFPLLLMGASQCSSMPTDQGQGAHDANDFTVVLQTKKDLAAQETVVIQAPGTVSQKGFLFLQSNEGSDAGLTDLTVLTPAAKCKRTDCARFQFFRKDGSAGYGAGIPMGQTSAVVHLSDIIGHLGAVTEPDDGEYRMLVQVYYTGTDGQEHSMLADGFVRFNVIAKAYQPLVCNDPSVAWRILPQDQCEAQFTTAFRTILCGGGCK